MNSVNLVQGKTTVGKGESKEDRTDEEEKEGGFVYTQWGRLILHVYPGSTADSGDRRCGYFLWFITRGPLTQEFIEEVEDVLPCRTCLLSRHLSKVGSAIVQVHPVDALGQEGQHALGVRPRTSCESPQHINYRLLSARGANSEIREMIFKSVTKNR